MTLRRTEVRVDCADPACTRATMPAWADPTIPGLAITKMHPPHHLAGTAVVERSWTVTHLYSGQTVGDAFYADRAAAEHVLARLGTLPVDWRQPEHVILSPGMAGIIAGIIAEGDAIRSGLNE